MTKPYEFPPPLSASSSFPFPLSCSTPSPACPHFCAAALITHLSLVCLPGISPDASPLRIFCRLNSTGWCTHLRPGSWAGAFSTNASKMPPLCTFPADSTAPGGVHICRLAHGPEPPQPGAAECAVPAPAVPPAPAPVSAPGGLPAGPVHAGAV